MSGSLAEGFLAVITGAAASCADLGVAEQDIHAAVDFGITNFVEIERRRAVEKLERSFLQ